MRFFASVFVEILTSQGAPPVYTVANLPPVSTTPVTNFATSTAGVVDTGGKGERLACGMSELSMRKGWPGEPQH